MRVRSHRIELIRILSCIQHEAHDFGVPILCSNGQSQMALLCSCLGKQPSRVFHAAERRCDGQRNLSSAPQKCVHRFQLKEHSRAFSRAILDDTEVPVPVEDAIRNMAVTEAIFRSGRSGQWETPRTASS